MTLSVLLGLFVAIAPTLAFAQRDTEKVRFLEFSFDSDVEVFDLDTVETLHPDKFAIKAVTHDVPEVMQFRLQAIEALRTYCAQPAGQYLFSSEMLHQAGPVTTSGVIEVIDNGEDADKLLTWDFRYRNSRRTELLFCRGVIEEGKPLTADEWYFWARDRIAKGVPHVEIFDCAHYEIGRQLSFNVSKTFMHEVRRESYGEEVYLRVCLAITGKQPYVPSKSQNPVPISP
ncbi:MAG TPA: hypothetical protein VEK74_05580 [Burkholderiaceae bacterium]|nr:hypothetical protein [Burkholderiaceae bacterium]